MTTKRNDGFATRRTVLLTGATGFIGRAVTARLLERGDRVIALTRNAARARRRLGPTPILVERLLLVERLADIPAAQAIDAVVNLAGAPILGRRWNKARKQELVASRVGMTRDLVDWLARRGQRPEVLVSASAVGWYGASEDDRPLDETAPAGTDFAAALCSAWEREATAAAALGLRVCRLRLGMVLGRDGGALAAMLPAARRGLGARIGDGRQWVSWIHRDDAVELILRASADPLFTGAINATAPVPLRQAELAAALGRVLHRRVLLRLPRWTLRAALGERAALLTEGARVVPKRALEIGFAFRCHDIEGALRDLLAPCETPYGATVRLLDNMLT